MKIISILGTPTGENGNTALLLEEVLKGAESLGAECETIVLRGDSIKLCTGCNLCHKVGTCHLKDDFESIKAKLLAADGIILATPNYISHVSAQLKIFLDRCAVIHHCMLLEGKYGVSLVTSGGGDERPIIEYLNTVLINSGVTPVDALWVAMGTTKDGILDEKNRNWAFNAGKNLVEAYNGKRKLVAVEKLKDLHRERMRKMISLRQDEWAYEYNYWQKHV